MSDLLVTDEAVEAAAKALCVAAGNSPEDWPDDVAADGARDDARVALEAALPLLQRQHLELAKTLGYGLGRRDAAEEIARAIEARKEFYATQFARRVLQHAVDVARDVGLDATTPPRAFGGPDPPHRTRNTCRRVYGPARGQ